MNYLSFLNALPDILRITASKNEIILLLNDSGKFGKQIDFLLGQRIEIRYRITKNSTKLSVQTWPLSSMAKSVENMSIDSKTINQSKANPPQGPKIPTGHLVRFKWF